MKHKAKLKRLETRIKGYEDTLKDRSPRVNTLSFHRPGSMTK